MAVSLGACATLPPPGPSVLGLPGKGKDLAAFQQDDAACRQYAQQHAVGSSAGAPAAPPALSQPYDVSYTQCLFSRGDTVQAMPGYAPAYAPIYADDYPGYPDYGFGGLAFGFGGVGGHYWGHGDGWRGGYGNGGTWHGGHPR